jgi:hypothetical protein
MRSEKRTYDEFVQELLGGGLDVVAESSNSSQSLDAIDLLGLDQFLDEHNGRVSAGLNQAVDKQGPVIASFTIC